MFNNPIIAGTLAGIVSALLFLGAAQGSALAIPLLIFSPLPILIVALGWLPLAGLLAAIAMMIVLSLVAGGTVALVSALILALPTLLTARWHVMRAPEALAGEAGGWMPMRLSFPVSLGVFSLCAVIAGLLSSASPAQIEIIANELLQQVFEAARTDATDPQIAEQFSVEYAQNLASSLARVFPVLTACIWVSILALNFFFAERLARSSGRLKRPAPNYPVQLRLEPLHIGVLAFGWLMFSYGGGLAPLGGVVLGAFGTGFVLVGLATFNLYMRNFEGRALVMFVSIVTIVVLSFPALIFFGLGIADVAFGLRDRVLANNTNKTL